jgi:hypothetical protein
MVASSALLFSSMIEDDDCAMIRMSCSPFFSLHKVRVMLCKTLHGGGFYMVLYSRKRKNIFCLTAPLNKYCEDVG